MDGVVGVVGTRELPVRHRASGYRETAAQMIERGAGASCEGLTGKQALGVGYWLRQAGWSTRRSLVDGQWCVWAVGVRGGLDE